jgi:hypothetical protein
VSGIPVHAVIGARGTGKSALIARHAAAHPDWLGFVNVRLQDLPNLVVSPAGCPCCTARVAMRVALTRLLRERKPSRIYVEMGEFAHAPQLARVLGEWPLSQYVAPAPAVSLP